MLRPISKRPEMSKQKRNTHSPELKVKVALEAVRGLKTANGKGRGRS
jgi:hypothetical protein